MLSHLRDRIRTRFVPAVEYRRFEDDLLSPNEEAARKAMLQNATTTPINTEAILLQLLRSPETREAIKSLNLKADIDIYTEFREIKVEITLQNEMCRLYVVLDEFDSDEDVSVNGVDFSIKSGVRKIKCFQENGYEGYKPLFSMLLDVFHVPELFHLCVYFRFVDDSRIFKKWLPNVKAAHLMIGGDVYRLDELKDLLDVFEGARSLSVMTVGFDETMNATIHDVVSTASSHILGLMYPILPVKLLRMPAEYVTFHNSEMTREMCVTYVHGWMQSRNKKLQCLEVQFKEPARTDMLEVEKWQIRQNQMFKPWNPRTREEHIIQLDYAGKGLEHLARRIPMTNALDVIRPDGLLASVLFTEYKFLFVVWRHRFPSKNRKLQKRLKRENIKILTYPVYPMSTFCY